MVNWKIKKWQSEKKTAFCIIALFAALFLCTVWVLPLDSRLSLVIEYDRDYSNDFNAQLFWNTGDGFSEEESAYKKVERNRVYLEIWEDAQLVQEFRLDPSDRNEEIAITSIQIKNYGVGVKMLPVREILNRAQFGQAESAEVIRGVLYIRPENDDPAIILGREIINDYFRSCDRKLKGIISVWICLLGVAAAMAVVHLQYLKKAAEYIALRYYEITVVILLVGLFLIGYMAFNSFDYAHPDENMSKAAVDYYMNHWVPADIRSDEVTDSFSAYGHSRLSETTVYYFLAGKAAWIAKNIFGLNKYYRSFNVFLFALMVGIYCRKGRKNGYLFLMLGLTPQIWYIFSYTTSDAWDYFLGFLILYQLAVEESIFRRAMRDGFSKQTAVGLGINGMLYGLLFLGKKNYYFIFLASFFLLLYEWIISPVKQKVQIVIKYGIIIAVCMSVFFGARFADTLRYDGNKSIIASECRESYAEKEVTGTESEPQGIWAGVRMKEQGISLEQIFSKYGFAKYSYRSYTGTYGWMEYENSGIYYAAMGIVYLAALLIFAAVLMEGKDTLTKGLVCLLFSLNIAIFGTSVWHSWTSDFQPQGRYLFAMNFILAVCSYIYREGLAKKKNMKLVICLSGMLSMFSFIFSGIFNLT